jgi:transcriptional regulator
MVSVGSAKALCGCGEYGVMTYRPPYFRMDDRAVLLPLIAEHPLATLITSHDGRISLTYLPMLARVVDDGILLEGHIARANDQWKFAPSDSVAAFRIAGHYISPTWYPSKETNPRTVPTYDYVALEARGPVRFVHDEEWLRAFVHRLTESQESRVGGTWSVDDAPADYFASQIRAIVGVEMRVQTLIGTFKLNQNHSRENIENVIASLEALGSRQASVLAEFMRK